jgi:hypothetical protein
MASPQMASANKPAYAPPPVDGDFYKIANVLNDWERAVINRVREFTERVVAPVIEDIGRATNFRSRSFRRSPTSALAALAMMDLARPAAAGC